MRSGSTAEIEPIENERVASQHIEQQDALNEPCDLVGDLQRRLHRFATDIGQRQQQPGKNRPYRIQASKKRHDDGHEGIRKVYRNVIRPERVAELLILRPDMPRSMAACMNELLVNLKMVANRHSEDTLRRAGRLQADLQYGSIEEILATGLHAYLTHFLARVGDLGAGISRDFLVPEAA